MELSRRNFLIVAAATPVVARAGATSAGAQPTGADELPPLTTGRLCPGACLDVDQRAMQSPDGLLHLIGGDHIGDAGDR